MISSRWRDRSRAPSSGRATRESTIDVERGDAGPSQCQEQAGLQEMRRAMARGPRERPRLLVLGAAGSGKSAVIRQGGLRFLEPMGPDGAGDARVAHGCWRWHVAEEAFLIEQSDPMPHAALAQLRVSRRHGPLNAVLLTLDVQILSPQARPVRRQVARSLLSTIQRAQAAFESRLPVYLMVTKCDLLPGFRATFDDLPADARNQVWGTTFDNPPPRGRMLRAVFSASFEDLACRLCAGLLRRMESEPDAARRAAMFEFPARFRALHPELVDFIEILSAGGEVDAPQLRGVYFCSAAPGGVADAYPAGPPSEPRAAPAGDPLFLAGLMRDVILAEASFAGEGAGSRRRRRRAGIARAWALWLAMAGVLLAWAASAWTQSRFLDRIERDAKALAVRRADAVAGRDPDDARHLQATLEAAQGLQRSAGTVGLPVKLLGVGEAGREAVEACTRNLYAKALRNLLVPRLLAGTAQELRGADSLAARYTALKRYVMLREPARFDLQQFLHPLASPLAVTGAQPATDWTAGLAPHIGAALNPWPVAFVTAGDSPLLEDARAHLAGVPLAERGYALLQALATTSELPEFRLSTAAGPKASQVFARRSGAPLSSGVAAFYTRAGQAELFESRAPGLLRQLGDEEAWILGTSRREAAVAVQGNESIDAVRALYLADQARAWDAFLADLRPPPRADSNRSLDAVALVAAPESPLRKLLLAVREQTSSPVVSMSPASPAPAAAALGTALPAPVPALQDALKGTVDTPSPLDDALARLADLESILRSNAGAGAGADGSPRASLSLEAARFASAASRLPPPVATYLSQLVASASDDVAMARHASLGVAARDEIGGFCRQALGGRFPFAAHASADVTLGDFSRLFSPGGMLDRFSRTHFVERGAEPVDRPMPASFVQATSIRDAFFSGEGARPAASVDLALQGVDDGIAAVTLVIDGMEVGLSAGNRTTAHLDWPAPSSAASIELRYALVSKAAPLVLSFDGPWALFRFVDRAVPVSGAPDHRVVSIDIDGHKAWFELRANSVRPAFGLPALAQFRCPA